MITSQEQVEKYILKLHRKYSYKIKETTIFRKEQSVFLFVCPVKEHWQIDIYKELAPTVSMIKQREISVNTATNY